MYINVNVENELLKKAMSFSKLKTKEELFDKALRLLVDTKRQEILKHQQKIRQFQGKLHWGWDDDEREPTNK